MLYGKGVQVDGLLQGSIHYTNSLCLVFHSQIHIIRYFHHKFSKHTSTFIKIHLKKEICANPFVHNDIMQLKPVKYPWPMNSSLDSFDCAFCWKEFPDFKTLRNHCVRFL